MIKIVSMMMPPQQLIDKHIWYQEQIEIDNVSHKKINEI